MTYILHFGTRKLIATVETFRTSSGFIASFTDNISGTVTERPYKTQTAIKAQATRYFDKLHRLYFAAWEAGKI